MNGMERSLSKLLNVSLVLRNCMRTSNCSTPRKVIRCMSQHYATNSEDVLLSKNLKQSTQWSKGNACITSMQTLKDANVCNMDVNESIETLDSLYKTHKYVDQDSVQINDITSDAKFVELCSNIQKCVREINIRDAITILKCLDHFRISFKTTLAQSILQILRLRINDMSLAEIMHISWLLTDNECSTPLLDALRIALPIAFENQLETECKDLTQISSLITVLTYMYEYNCKTGFDIVIKAITRHSKDIGTYDMCKIFYILSMSDHVAATHMQDLGILQTVLTNDLRFLQTRHIRKLLEGISKRVLKGDMEFYDETLIDKLVNIAIDKNMSFDNGIQIAQYLNRMHYAHINLLDYLTAKVVERPVLLQDYASTFVESLSLVDYKPAFWDLISNQLKQCDLEKLKEAEELCSFAENLAVLDCYCDHILEKIFSINVADYPNNIRHKIKSNISSVYQGIEAFMPDFHSLAIQHQIPDKIENDTMLPDTDFSLQKALEKAVGGSQYVLHNLKTKYGHFINHVVIIQKGGFPVPINFKESTPTSSMIYVESLEPPTESEVILIFNIPAEAYSINSQRLKGNWSLKLRTAKSLTGYNTIAINKSLWHQLPRQQQIPYLVQAIKLKCKDLFVKIN